ncbi:MAG TPA: TSUP family transporter [Polyangiaceae bacterium]|nr:TSUP family transporter [Polyangiaceae bacterium]
MISPFILGLLALTAFVAGVVDAVAGGGGLFTVPALLAVGLPPSVALATNKGQAAPGAVSSFWTFFRRGGIDRKRAPLGFVCGFAGSLLGARLLLAMRPEPLRPIIALLLLFALAVMLLRSRIRLRSTPLSHPRLALVLMALGMGLYDGFFGPGTGSLLIVLFVTFFGDSPLYASGNAKVVNLASNLAAFATFTLRGAVLWQIAAPMAVANIVGARLGARLALRQGDGFVRVVVTVVVLAVVAKIVFDMLKSAQFAAFAPNLWR